MSIHNLCPLLRKDLREQAAQKKTYITRLIFGLLLYAVFLSLWNKYSQRNLGDALGEGRQIAGQILAIAFAAIHLLVPILSAGVIASERERNSLDLLFISSLSPGEILWQKWLASVIPMVTLLLMTVPAIALAYGLGGISIQYLIGGVYCLCLSLLQVSIITVTISSYCRSTTQAVLMTYVICGFLYTGELLLYLFTGRAYSYSQVFPPVIFFDTIYQGLRRLFTITVFVWITILPLPIFARFFITRKPRKSTSVKLPRFLQILRTPTAKYNIKDLLLNTQPLAWRDLAKYRGKISPLAWLVLATGLIAFLDAMMPREQKILTVLNLLFFATAALWIAVRYGNLFASEQHEETLGTLLATPLSTREILRQKMRAIDRFLLFLHIALILLVCAKTVGLLQLDGYRAQRYPATPYFLAAMGSVLVYIPMLKWTMVWLGLKIRAKTKTTLFVVVVLLSWSLIPWVGYLVLTNASSFSRETSALTLLFSPLTLPFCAEIHDYPNFDNITNKYLLFPNNALINNSSETFVFANIILYVTVWIIFRTMCRSRCHIYLQRPE